MIRVYENHITYDYVHEDEARCNGCDYRRRHLRIDRAFICRWECEKELMIWDYYGRPRP